MDCWPLSRHDENSNGVRGPSSFALEKQQRHHGMWRVSTLENHGSNGRGVRTMTEMTQRQKDAVFTSGDKHCTKNFTMLLRHSSWLNHLVRHVFTGCNLDILEFAFGSVLVMTDDSHAKNSSVACWHRRGGAEDRPSQATKYVSERPMRHHMSLHKSSQCYVTRTGAASTWKTCTVTATTTR